MRGRLAMGVLWCLVAFPSAARATCGSANCFLVTGTQEGVGFKGALVADLSYRYVVQSKKLEGTRPVGEVLTPKVSFEEGELEPDHHREVRTQNTLVQLDLSWGATDKLTFAASLPLINDRDHEHFDEVGTPEEFFTTEDGSSGFGDVRVGARYGFLTRSKDLLVGGLSLELPTGQYKLRDSEGDINEPTIQPGSGSLDAAASVYYAHQWIPHRFDSFVSVAQKINSENDLDYRIGVETLLNAGVDYATGGKLTWSLQLNGRKTAHDRFLGDLVPSTGTLFVHLTPGLRIQASTATSFYTFLQFPIHLDVNDDQLAPRTGLLAGVSRTF